MIRTLFSFLLSQVDPSPAAAAAWLSPSVVLTIVGGAATLIAFLISWSVVQDRRINARLSLDVFEKWRKEELGPSLAAITSSIVDLGKAVAAAQSRDACVLCRREVEDKLAALHDEVRDRPTRASMNQAFEEIRALKDELSRTDRATTERVIRLEGKIDAVLQAIADLKTSIASRKRAEG